MRLPLLLMAIGHCIISYAQTPEDTKAIMQWQSQHPTILLISQERFNSMSADEKKTIGDNYILFAGEITAEQLKAKDAELSVKSAVQDEHSQLGEEELSFVKNWLGQNKHVRIVKQSQFILFSDERKAYCEDISNQIMVLAGENVTRADIHEYEN